MACNSDFLEFVCSQIADAGEVRSRKMFGDKEKEISKNIILLMLSLDIRLSKVQVMVMANNPFLFC